MIEGNSIRIIGCETVAEFLRTTDTFTTLELRGNNIGESGISALAEYFGRTTTLKQ